MIGHTGIKTLGLAQFLAHYYGDDFRSVSRTWRTISFIISPEISLIPNLKIVTFKDDEPILIEEKISNGQFNYLNPSKMLRIPQSVKLSGPAYDTIVDAENRIFQRNILKYNEGEMRNWIVLPISVERIYKNPSNGSYIYDPKPVEINPGEYVIHGFIGIDLNEDTFAVFSDHLRRGKYLCFFSGIPIYKESIDTVNEHIVRLMKHQSVLFLLTKADEFYIDMPMLSTVPKKLFNALNNSI